ncbi:hypothetical protein SAMN04488058_105219 [Deinococcus reticulitermitis]|uniref:Uncharacterized protein n=2 Tax=Deinococcus reticulitermitis TaxID=856736 RepID=A0A1H6XUZ3_9DEIO|nr:hypothetical protein SAMN04488058_105219 [Deinococcus reticulitermitis]
MVRLTRGALTVGALSGGFLLGNGASAAPSLLGGKFSEGTFPLCRTYGCRVTERRTTPDGALVRLQLQRQDARVLLVLSPYGTVMGLEAWLPGRTTLSAASRAFLQRVAVQAAEQELSSERLKTCFAGLEGRASGLRSARLLGGGGEHYGVVCLRRAGGWGVRVYFDH